MPAHPTDPLGKPIYLTPWRESKQLQSPVLDEELKGCLLAYVHRNDRPTIPVWHVHTELVVGIG